MFGLICLLIMTIAYLNFSSIALLLWQTKSRYGVIIFSFFSLNNSYSSLCTSLLLLFWHFILFLFFSFFFLFFSFLFFLILCSFLYSSLTKAIAILYFIVRFCNLFLLLFVIYILKFEYYFFFNINILVSKNKIFINSNILCF
jgi:hypothetical protein